MNKTLFLIFSILLFLSINFNCKKEETCPEANLPFPSVTTSGENTFGCQINQREWVAYTPSEEIFDGFISGGKPPSYLPPLEISIDSNAIATIIARRKITGQDCTQQMNQSIYLYFDVTQDTTQLFSESKLYDGNSFTRFHLDSNFINMIAINNFDTTNLILSTTFDCQMISEDGIDTLVFSRGRFDGNF